MYLILHEFVGIKYGELCIFRIRRNWRRILLAGYLRETVVCISVFISVFCWYATAVNYAVLVFIEFLVIEFMICLLYYISRDLNSLKA